MTDRLQCDKVRTVFVIILFKLWLAYCSYTPEPEFYSQFS